MRFFDSSLLYSYICFFMIIDKRKKRLIYVKSEGARADEGYQVHGESTFRAYSDTDSEEAFSEISISSW
jgi:hypothetical protein